MFRGIWVPQVLTLTKQALHLPLPHPSWSQVPPSGFFSTTESPLTLAIQNQYCPSPNAGQSVPFSPPPEDSGAWRPHSWVLLEAAREKQRHQHSRGFRFALGPSHCSAQGSASAVAIGKASVLCFLGCTPIPTHPPRPALNLCFCPGDSSSEIHSVALLGPQVPRTALLGYPEHPLSDIWVLTSHR